MDKTVSVKAIPIQYGDVQIRAKIMENGAKKTGEGLPNFHSHKQYECHFIEKGFLEIHTEDRIVALSQSQMLIIPPNLGHFATVSNGTFESHVITFSLSQIESCDVGVYAFFKEVFEQSACVPINIPQKLIELIKEFKASSVEGVTEYVNSVTRLGNIIAGVINALKISEPVKQTVAGMSDLEMLLDTCINNPEMTLNDIAKAMSYSQRHLSRKIREWYGMSLSDLRNQRRVQMAKKLLEEPGCTIEQVAVESGFKSASAMRCMFKKHANITPSAYRKSKLKES